jgi:2,4-dienoyl-CoA reductase-like NADH-dependent reductase (Old Yellow Enzyme family)
VRPRCRSAQKQEDFYRDITRGGIGLLITGYAFVCPESKALPYQMGTHNDDFEVDYRKLVEAVHAAGGKIAIQHAHAEGQATSPISG